MLILWRVSLGGSEGRFRDDMRMKETAERQRAPTKKLHVERNVDGNTLPPSVV